MLTNRGTYKPQSKFYSTMKSNETLTHYSMKNLENTATNDKVSHKSTDSAVSIYVRGSRRADQGNRNQAVALSKLPWECRECFKQ